MLVNQCDNCKEFFDKEKHPDWINIRSSSGLIVTTVDTKAVLHLTTLDLCSPACAAEWVSSTTKRLQEATANDPGV